jgi:hypothetical protein
MSISIQHEPSGVHVMVAFEDEYRAYEGIRVLEVRHVLLGGPHRGVFGAFRLALLLEPTLAVDGGSAAVAGGRYSLAVAGV